VASNPHRGFGFPFRFLEGRVRTAGGAEESEATDGEISESVEMGVVQVLLTQRGERPMLYNFGVGAAEVLFSPLRSILVPLLKNRIAEQVGFWVSRADVQHVDAAVVPINGMLLARVDFRLRDREYESAVTMPLGVRHD